jgi:hypothetical protein
MAVATDNFVLMDKDLLLGQVYSQTPQGGWGLLTGLIKKLKKAPRRTIAAGLHEARFVDATQKTPRPKEFHDGLRFGLRDRHAAGFSLRQIGGGSSLALHVLV